MDGAPTSPRTWAFVLLAALTIAFGVLALTLRGSGSTGEAGTAPSPTLTHQGAFSWRVTTVPSRVHHGQPMRFDVTVTTPYGPLLDFDMSSVDYGDGSAASGGVDFDAAGPRPCSIELPSNAANAPSSLGAPSPSVPPMSMADHTYARAGRYTAVIGYANNCVPMQSETVRYTVVVR